MSKVAPSVLVREGLDRPLQQAPALAGTSFFDSGSTRGGGRVDVFRARRTPRSGAVHPVPARRGSAGSAARVRSQPEQARPGEHGEHGPRDQ
jgi:hypothetical protein